MPFKTNLQKSLEALGEIDPDTTLQKVRKSLQKATREDLLKLLHGTQKHAQPIKESKFHLYKPVSGVAEAFHRSPAMIRLLLGGNRASKTTTASVDTIIHAAKVVPDSLKDLIPTKRLVPGPVFDRIVATDFPNGIEKTVKPKIYEWSPPDYIADYSAEFRIFSIATGSKIELMTYDQDLPKHGGAGRDRIQFDEEPSEAIYDEALMRIIDTGGDIVIAMTPVSGMTWVYDRLYLKAGKITAMVEENGEKQVVVRENPEGDLDIEVFVLSTFDNPHLSQEAISALDKKLDNQDERRIRLGGEFVSFSGLVYYTYSSSLHDVDPFHIPNLEDWERSDGQTKPWPVFCALDPHPRVPHAYLMCAVDPYGRKFFFEEFFEDLDIDPLATRIKVLEHKYWVIWRLIDPAAKTEDPVHRTCLFDELQTRGILFQPAPKDPTNGILRVREGLGVRDREGVTGRVRMPEIYFFKTLKRTKYEIVRYVWDDWRKVKDQRTPKARPKDKDDHQMENLYRIILREPPWLDYNDEVKPMGEWRYAP